MLFRFRLRAYAQAFFSTLAIFCAPAWAAPVEITLLHTNDLHSHFRPARDELGLGGLARIKTAIDRARRTLPNTLVVDGGDWSEGQIYYNEGTGRETVKMMSSMGYDVAVVGNHDWLNGPDFLLSAIGAADPRLSFISANLNPSDYDRAEEFRAKIPPFVIREIGGVKIAFIGLSTYELIYDRFMEPVKIEDPFLAARELARNLRQSADAVIVISHNSTHVNEALLKTIPEIDLVIGAHDHKKYTRPVVVSRPVIISGGTPTIKEGWLVETGCWGEYLGRVDLKVLPREEARARGVSPVELVHYGLTQMDSSIPEDPEALRRIDALETKLERSYGPIFHDEVARSEVKIGRVGMETRMGNLATDAYRQLARTDLALEVTNFVYGEIPRGVIRSADVFNANPAVYNPRTGRSWTLHTLPMKGRTLQWAMNLFFASKLVAQAGVMNFSHGTQLLYDPETASPSRAQLQTAPGRDYLLFSSAHGLSYGSAIAQSIGALETSSGGQIQALIINGEPVDPDKTYTVALGGGLVDAIDFIDSAIPNMVPTEGMVDTGLEDWRVVADYLHAITPVTAINVPIEGRVQTEQADLGLTEDDIRFSALRKVRGGLQGHVLVTLRNLGGQTSLPFGPRIRILANENGRNLAEDPAWRQLGDERTIPALAPGEEKTFEWDVRIPFDREIGGLVSITADISGNASEVNHSNDQITRWFALGRAGHEERPRPRRDR